MPSPAPTPIELNEESPVHHSPTPVAGGLVGGLGHLPAAAAVAIWSPGWSGTAALLAGILPGVLAASGAVLVALGAVELVARRRRDSSSRSTVRSSQGDLGGRPPAANPTSSYA